MRSDSFLSLVKLGIGHKATHLNEKIDWLYIQTLAYQHGLSGIVLDGVDKLPEDKRPPKDIASKMKSIPKSTTNSDNKIVCINCGTSNQQNFYQTKDKNRKYFGKIPYCKAPLQARSVPLLKTDLLFVM